MAGETQQALATPYPKVDAQLWEEEDKPTTGVWKITGRGLEELDALHYLVVV